MKAIPPSDSITLSGLYQLIHKHRGIYLLVVTLSFLMLFFHIKSQYTRYHIRQKFLIRGGNQGIQLLQVDQLRKNLERDPEILDQVQKLAGQNRSTLDQMKGMLNVKIQSLDDYENSALQRVQQFMVAFSVLHPEKETAHKILGSWSQIAVKYVETRNQNTRNLRKDIENSLQSIRSRCSSKELAQSRSLIALTVKKLEEQEKLFPQGFQKFKGGMTSDEGMPLDELTYFHEQLKTHTNLLRELDGLYEQSQTIAVCTSLQNRIQNLDQNYIDFKPVGNHEALLMPSDYFVPAIVVALVGSLLIGILLVAVIESLNSQGD
ncbi:MAG: hypothetical protein EXS63_08535 [Candidatus Omnitrophica bacterium]|nr:hypothetical protein [Candidatus Omnitrophota bacterium]